jgi:hypothetical protein
MIPEIVVSIFVASTWPIVPAVVSVEVATPQIDVGTARIFVASELDAAVTNVLVFALTTAASEDVAVRSAASVCAFVAVVPDVIATPSELDAVETSAVVARLPDVRPAAVNVREALAQTLPGIEVMLEAMDATADDTEVIALPNELEAFSIEELVFAFTTAASELVAVSSAESVCAFTATVCAAVCEPVLAFTIAATDDVAVWISPSVASEPLVRPAPVRVRVPFVQTSAANVPKVVRLRVPLAHTLAGMDVIEVATDAIAELRLVIPVPSELEAVRTLVLVFALTTAASEVVAV